MRLDPKMAIAIKEALLEAEPGSSVRLFGSRTDDRAKGGDIDVLWLTDRRVSSQTIRRIKIELYKRFGWQKIDIVNFGRDDKDPFKTIALQTAIDL